METFDVVVIGGGPAGYVAGIRAAQLGMTVAIIDRAPVLGGTCLRVGCIPSKALLESSELFVRARDEFAAHGINIPAPSLDLAQMMKRKTQVVKDTTDGLALLMKKNQIKVFQGRGSLAANLQVTIENDGEQPVLQAQHIIIATGSAPVELPFLRFDGNRVVTSTEALSFDSVPEHLAVIGAGAVGLELGSVWNRLGARVTVVEMLAHIAPFADKQMSTMLQRTLKKRGLEFKLGTRVTSGRVSADDVTLTLENNKGELEDLTCSKVLVAVGRRAYTSGLGLGNAGVAADQAGKILIDDKFRTNVANIYAIGDVVRGPMLAHKGEEEGIAVAEIIAGRSGHVNYNAIPNVVYTSPELAMVGMTEEEAEEGGVNVTVARSYFKANARARTMAQEDGLIKIIASIGTDRLLGIHILGPHASELIAEAAVALEMGASAEDLARTSHAHPTLSEVLKEAAMAIDKRSIHG